MPLLLGREDRELVVAADERVGVRAQLDVGALRRCLLGLGVVRAVQNLVDLALLSARPLACTHHAAILGAETAWRTPARPIRPQRSSQLCVAVHRRFPVSSSQRAMAYGYVMQIMRAGVALPPVGTRDGNRRGV